MRRDKLETRLMECEVARTGDKGTRIKFSCEVLSSWARKLFRVCAMMLTHSLLRNRNSVPTNSASVSLVDLSRTSVPSGEFGSAHSHEVLRNSGDSERASHTFSDLTQSSIQSLRDEFSVKHLSEKQSRFEEEVIDSLNALTDRINAVESLVADREMATQKRLESIHTGVRSALLGVVRRLVSYVRATPLTQVKSRPSVRGSPLQSRIGMQRTRTTPVRE